MKNEGDYFQNGETSFLQATKNPQSVCIEVGFLGIAIRFWV